MATQAVRDQLRRALGTLDVAGDGLLDRDLLLRILVRMAPGLPERDLLRLLDDVAAASDSKDHAGRLSCEEFVSFFADGHAKPAEQPSSKHELFPESPEWVAALRAEFGASVACVIEEPEHRGISLAQLRRLEAFFTKHCGTWHDRAPPSASKRSGMMLEAESLNLYHLNDWVIRPATAGLVGAEETCSMVELLASGRQTPDWFVSHWWGEAVRAFVRSCERHAALRAGAGGAWEAMLYWVCAYANRQHQLGKDMAEDPNQSSFRKAMELSVGILLILDSHGTPFTRIWCCFEIITTLQQTPKLLNSYNFVSSVPRAEDFGKLFDIVTDDKDGNPCVLAEGDLPSESTYQQMQREQGFPVSILLDGIKTRLQDGMASQNIDRIRILNCIQGFGGEDLNDDSVLEEERMQADATYYRHFNMALRARLALAAWPLLLKCPRPGQTLCLPNWLQKDITRTNITLDVSGITAFNGERYAELAQGLPPMLEAFTLIMAGCPVDDDGLGVMAARLEKCLSLRQLTLGHAGAPEITDKGVEMLASRLPLQLECFHVCLVKCGGTSFTDDGLRSLARGLTRLKQVRGIWLNLMDNPCLTGEGLRAIAKAVRTLPRLQYLRLGLEGTLPVNRRLAFTSRAQIRRWSEDPVDPTTWVPGGARPMVEAVELQAASVRALLQVCCQTGAEYAIFWEPSEGGRLRGRFYFDPPERISDYAQQRGDDVLFTSESCKMAFEHPGGAPLQQAVLLSGAEGISHGIASFDLFSRREVAAEFGIRSVALVPCAGGILEYGSRAQWEGLVLPHDSEQLQDRRGTGDLAGAVPVP